MKIFLKVLKGILVGLGSILPGLSGGMIAASFNIYKDLIEALNGFIKKPIKSVLSIWEYLVGIFIGVAVGFILIATVLKLFPIPITMLFVGLIIGGIPEIYNGIKNKEKKWYHYLVMVVMMVIMIVLLTLKPADMVSIGAPKIYFVYILIGVLTALTLIIPGLSGTMILMALGFYTYMTTTVADFIKYVITLDISNALSNLSAVAIMALSGFIALIIFSKLLHYVLKKYELVFNMAIFGILLVSPINIIWTLQIEDEGIFTNLSVWTYVFSILSLIVGVIGAYKMFKLGKKVEEENEIEKTFE
ncbi:DUF368 domain-containing protein [Haploplasma axanthum]|uniref:Domain of uncharacterized function (DUF368) n=1 Tax=Haploplasma axanthum TaxID=29552 RepID=A0A449BCF1_HAPAX|nr:DUF368 domain-containing protein [Haploplasma axanthum]VEU80000.1 Domain of uncharacterised function (DUF368) [Haploplasma axanthum]